LRCFCFDPERRDKTQQLACYRRHRDSLVLALANHASRFLLTGEARSSTKEDYALTVFERLFKERGLPANIRSDNGVPFSSALRYLTPEEFEQASIAKESDGADGSGGKPKTGLPPLPHALGIPPGFPHSRSSGTAYR
jgi:hypothetical protein